MPISNKNLSEAIEVTVKHKLMEALESDLRATAEQTIKRELLAIAPDLQVNARLLTESNGINVYVVYKGKQL
jgi:hypothetical protein